MISNYKTVKYLYEIKVRCRNDKKQSTKNNNYHLLPEEKEVAAALGLDLSRISHYVDMVSTFIQTGSFPPTKNDQVDKLEKKLEALGKDESIHMMDLQKQLDNLCKNKKIPKNYTEKLLNLSDSAVAQMKHLRESLSSYAFGHFGKAEIDSPDQVNNVRCKLRKISEKEDISALELREELLILVSDEGIHEKDEQNLLKKWRDMYIHVRNLQQQLLHLVEDEKTLLGYLQEKLQKLNLLQEDNIELNFLQKMCQGLEKNNKITLKNLQEQLLGLSRHEGAKVRTIYIQLSNCAEITLIDTVYC